MHLEPVQALEAGESPQALAETIILSTKIFAFIVHTNLVQVIVECQSLRERCRRLEELVLQREQNEQGKSHSQSRSVSVHVKNGDSASFAELRQKISELEGDLREKQHLVEEHARKEQQIEVGGGLCVVCHSYGSNLHCCSHIHY